MADFGIFLLKDGSFLEILKEKRWEDQFISLEHVIYDFYTEILSSKLNNHFLFLGCFCNGLNF